MAEQRALRMDKADEEATEVQQTELEVVAERIVSSLPWLFVQGISTAFVYYSDMFARLSSDEDAGLLAGNVPAGALMLLDTGVHLALGFRSRSIPYLSGFSARQQPGPYVYDALGFLLPALGYALRPVAEFGNSWNTTVQAQDDIERYIRLNILTSALLLPAVVFKFLASVWRYRSWCVIRRARVAAGGASPGPSGHLTRLWTLAFLHMTALGAAVAMSLMQAYLQLDPRLTVISRTAPDFVRRLSLIENRPDALRVLDDAIVQGLGAAEVSFTQVTIDGEVAFGPPSEALVPPDDYVYISSDNGRVRALFSSDEISSFDAHVAFPLVKTVILGNILLLMVSIIGLTGRAILRPLISLLGAVLEAGRLVDRHKLLGQTSSARNASGSGRGGRKSLGRRGDAAERQAPVDSVEEAVDKIVKLVYIITKQYRGGKVVLRRIIDSGARDINQGMLNWATLYDNNIGSSAAERERKQSEALFKFRDASIYEKSFRKDAAPTLGSEDFDTLSLKSDELFGSVMSMFRNMALLQTGSRMHRGDDMRPDVATLERFLELLEACYIDNPYHNWRHAVDVTHSVYVMLQKDAGLQEQLGQLDKLCLMVAALAHDVGHRGMSNQYLVGVRDELAITYNDQSVQENMHAATLFKLLEEHPDANVLGNLDPAKYARARQSIIGLILATDMVEHFNLIAKLEVVVEEHGPVLPFGQGPAQSQSLGRQHKQLVMQGILHTADLGHTFKAESITTQWTTKLFEEFFSQGDKERELGMPVLPIMDRSVQYVPSGQMDFIQIVLLPWVSAMARVAPGLTYLLDRLERSFQHWAMIVEKDRVSETQRIAEDASAAAAVTAAQVDGNGVAGGKLDPPTAGASLEMTRSTNGKEHVPVPGSPVRQSPTAAGGVGDSKAATSRREVGFTTDTVSNADDDAPGGGFLPGTELQSQPSHAESLASALRNPNAPASKGSKHTRFSVTNRPASSEEHGGMSRSRRGSAMHGESGTLKSQLGSCQGRTITDEAMQMDVSSRLGNFMASVSALRDEMLVPTMSANFDGEDEALGTRLSHRSSMRRSRDGRTRKSGRASAQFDDVGGAGRPRRMSRGGRPGDVVPAPVGSVGGAPRGSRRSSLMETIFRRSVESPRAGAAAMAGAHSSHAEAPQGPGGKMPSLLGGARSRVAPEPQTFQAPASVRSDSRD
ncbi:unnamed protein product [Pedinophyceae sp. YPF-701]|nr:unnamed protein product [Pedinophyceae sp. YPF-701]